MEIKFIGTGGAFDVTSGNSSALIRAHDTCILIDCGHSVFPRLVCADLIDEIDALLITHFHDDHVGSLSSLLFYRVLVLKMDKIPIYLPTDEFRQELIRFLKFAVGTPEDFADFRLLSELPWVSAIDTFGQHVSGMQTYAYCFQDKNEAIAYSGDLGQPALFFDRIRQLGLSHARVFHDVFFHGESSAHTSYKELEKYMDEFEIYGYHCSLEHRPQDLRLPLVAEHPELLITS